ncbi:hypothetical protein M409DRAFT_22727 [Zasmidium cellare ATCC 36951]|uniref:Uncharacterized protein n=1 Tax=Zasmidium cellare ATCC 36951 TaxID=1080233 RepID=A0A6A6CMB8_ZASCE|nr:uncharacterized protein M409DRAFT_22727 [Zasmidium cellare ATCC 36951]KAF2167300.1 hypothetical protein M409DRAFT_22727 [Zasmidium cellare ATCC 36951]
MPPIKRHEWLCLRALKPRQRRFYATASESSPPEQTPTDSNAPPLSHTEPPTTPPSQPKADRIRAYLEEQDTLALTHLKAKLQKVHQTATQSQTLLLHLRQSSSTTTLLPGKIPPYTSRLRTTSPEEIRSATAHLHAVTENILANIWDLENIRYPHERGPSAGQRYSAEMKGLVGRGVAREVEAERMEMRNRVDVYRKRYAQKVEGLRGIVDDMRRGMGLSATRRSGRGMGAVVGVERVEEGAVRNPFGRGGGVREDIAAVGDEEVPEVGTAKVEAEAEAVNRTITYEPTTAEAISTDTIGTTKIEAEASTLETNPESSLSTPNPPPSPPSQTTYSPLHITYTPSGPPTEPEAATLYAVQKAATSNNRKPRSSSPPTKTPPPLKFVSPKANLSPTERMNQLLSNLQADAALKRGEVVVGGVGVDGDEKVGEREKGTVTEEKRDVDERRGNPFAR